MQFYITLITIAIATHLAIAGIGLVVTIGLLISYAACVAKRLNRRTG